MRAPATGGTLVQVDDILLSSAGVGTYALAERNIINVAAASSYQIAAQLSHNTVYYYASINLDVTTVALSGEDSLFHTGFAIQGDISLNTIFDSSPFPWITVPTKSDSVYAQFLVGEDTFDLSSRAAASIASSAAVESASYPRSEFPLKAYAIAIKGLMRAVLPQFFTTNYLTPVFQYDTSLALPPTSSMRIRGRIRKLYSVPPSLALSEDEVGGAKHFLESTE